uniref:Uracil phosphoribosyltransferase n=1 Tax=Lophurella stichidiosa TaxID=2008659 RepID=UPI002551EE01|nr:Uracil phosphoribosyltransferase [Aphanocladia stichidiosa]WGH13973.1 Uracil phosphoribosyltransferase [Aphanocladia stichidiosa]
MEIKLNIYEISHPIIKILLTRINKNKKQENYKYIGFLLIYEIFRKYIDINKIYIKQVKKIKDYNVINKNKKYFILTNLSNTYDIINEIKIVLPQIDIIHIDYSNTEQIEKSIKNLKIDLERDKILILEKVTNNHTIMNLIQYLKKQKNLHNKDINIGCIISYEETLNQIAHHYPKLKVYTTKIIYQNK